jgi:hypothetical protein
LVDYQTHKTKNKIKNQKKKVKNKNGNNNKIEFLPDKTILVNKKDFNGKEVQRVQFTVIDLEREDLNRKQKKFELSRKHVKKVLEEFKKGKTIMQVIRSGTGVNTNYIIKAVK